jgi:hypothetical protein
MLLCMKSESVNVADSKSSGCPKTCHLDLSGEIFVRSVPSNKDFSTSSKRQSEVFTSFRTACPGKQSCLYQIQMS